MNRSIRLVGIVVLGMFIALFVSTTTIQVFQADNLSAMDGNTRSLYDSYDIKRGPILVDGQEIASSTPVDTEYKYQRSYANGPLYSAVTGYFTNTQGSMGIEDAMNAELSGKSDAQFFDGLSRLFTGQSPAGAAVELSISPAAQQAALDGLGADKGAVVALDPATGAILAMVSTPGYDPNALAVPDEASFFATYNALLEDESGPLQNRAIGGDLNPPGSVFKLVIAAAALDAGIATPDSPLENPATWQLPGSTAVINNPTHGAPCGDGPTTTLRTAIEFSCNIPFAQLAIQLGEDRVRAMTDKLGFGHQFTVPMAATESTYPAGPLDDAQIALTGFGQYDVRTTPLQMALVSGAIANDGVVMNPTTVEQVLTEDLKEIQGPQVSEFGRAFSEQVANDLESMMIASVSSGVASNARIDGVDVAGKTGTAENGEDEPYSLWFTGFVATGDSHVAVAVVVEDGGGFEQQGTGNGSAATIGQQVMKAVLDG